jgi:periplasmic protein TonB
MAMAAISGPDRAKAAAGAVSLQLLLGLALISGLAVTSPESAKSVLKVFAVALPEPPPPIREPARRPEQRRNRPEGGSPPNLRARPTEVVAPKPAILLPVPNPIPAAETPGPGSASWAGAADVPGPGTGTGGTGRGTGTGDGDGDGEGGGAMTPPRRIRGSLRDSDYPGDAGEAGVSGSVEVLYRVGVDGMVSDCRVVRSSGSRLLDDTTCRLIERRFRFRPSLDARGRPIASRIIENHEWIVEDEAPPPRRRY